MSPDDPLFKILNLDDRSGPEKLMDRLRRLRKDFRYVRAHANDPIGDPVTYRVGERTIYEEAASSLLLITVMGRLPRPIRWLAIRTAKS